MTMKKNRLWLLALVPLLAACTETVYNSEPVVGPNDHRGTKVPDYDDDEAVEKQDCFRISIWTDRGLTTDEKNVGIACIDDENKEKTGDE